MLKLGGKIEYNHISICESSEKFIMIALKIKAKNNEEKTGLSAREVISVFCFSYKGKLYFGSNMIALSNDLVSHIHFFFQIENVHCVGGFIRCHTIKKSLSPDIILSISTIGINPCASSVTDCHPSQ